MLRKNHKFNYFILGVCFHDFGGLGKGPIIFSKAFILSCFDLILFLQNFNCLTIMECLNSSLRNLYSSLSHIIIKSDLLFPIIYCRITF